MVVRVGDSGKPIYLNAGIDMSAHTGIEVVFTDPNGVSTTKTSANGVALGAVDVIDDDGTVFKANEYAQYQLETGFIDQEGSWQAYLVFKNTTASPAKVFHSETHYFHVEMPGGC